MFTQFDWGSPQFDRVFLIQVVLLRHPDLMLGKISVPELTL